MLGLFGKKTTNVVKGSNDKEVAAAITMALMSNNDMAAIAMALCLYNDECHDYESEVITFKRGYSEWNSKSVKLLSTAYRR